MAETLTFDNTTEQTSADSLTTEEQDSLQVGEQIQQQESELLAGKYENAQQLEKAYIELQKKMGEDKPEEEQATEETPEETPPIEITPAVEAINIASQEFEKTGTLSEETISSFSEMNSKDLVDTYMKLVNQGGELSQSPAAVDLTDSQVNTIQNSVGGEATYNRLLDWATDNISPDQMSSFDQLVANGDANAIQLAVSGMKAQYDNSQGYEGRMLSGKAPQTSGDVYRSQAEVVKAMSHPDYDNDPAYRQDVIDKLSRSDVSF
tara:strand:- start:266 stop:1057 length:792 start_codon:yes stop_codon:yes gene_type:complete